MNECKPLVHGGAYVRMLVSGQRHTAMDVLQHLDRRGVPTLIVSGGRDLSVSKVGRCRLTPSNPR